MISVTNALKGTGIDVKKKVFKEIHDSGVTVVVVTHDMNIVLKYANKVVLMDDGEIKNVSTPNELFRETNELHSLDMPIIFQFAKDLINKGLPLDLTNINDISSLAKEIKRVK